MLRERLAKLEDSHHSSNSSLISHKRKTSTNDHHRHGSLAEDFDSNVSSPSASSVIHHEAVIEQPKYFDRKRRSRLGLITVHSYPWLPWVSVTHDRAWPWRDRDQKSVVTSIRKREPPAKWMIHTNGSKKIPSKKRNPTRKRQIPNWHHHEQR